MGKVNDNAECKVFAITDGGEQWIEIFGVNTLSVDADGSQLVLTPEAALTGSQREMIRGKTESDYTNWANNSKYKCRCGSPDSECVYKQHCDLFNKWKMVGVPENEMCEKVYQFQLSHLLSDVTSKTTS